MDCFVVTSGYFIIYTSGYLIFLLHTCGRLFISRFIAICGRTFATMPYFYGDHTTCADLRKNFMSLILSAISSIFRWTWKVWHKCSFISLSSLSQKEQVGLKFFKLMLFRVSFLCVSVLPKTLIFSIPSVSCSFWYSFLFCSNLYLLCLAT